MIVRRVLPLAHILGVVLAASGCTTVLGTNIATDNVLLPAAGIEPLGRVKAVVSEGRWFWAKEMDKQMYDEVKQAALKQKGGDLLVNAKITTTLTSYLGVFYKTDLAVEGMAAKRTAVYRADR